jgi:hypothetical protein
MAALLTIVLPHERLEMGSPFRGGERHRPAKQRALPISVCAGCAPQRGHGSAAARLTPDPNLWPQFAHLLRDVAVHGVALAFPFPALWTRLRPQ